VVNVVSGSEPILPYSVEVHHDLMYLDSGPSMLGVVNEASGNERVHTKSFNEGCERCPPVEHKYHNCPKRRASSNHECCGGLGKHLMNCPQGIVRSKEGLTEDARLLGKVNVVLGAEPLLPHSVEVQHNWTESEVYPHSSFTFKPAQPTSVGAKRKEKSGEAESESEEDDEYPSSEDEGEVFIRGALNKKKRGASKEYLTKHREPVVNPLLVEERVNRKETRVLNREACQQRNLAMIKAIMGDVMDKLNTHRHIKHFRTDLHKYIDLNFNHVKDVPETMNARPEIVQEEDQAVPVLPETGTRAPESARPSFVTEANRVPVNPSQTTGVTNIKLDVDPKFDKTNYQTEIVIEIEQKPFRIIADLGATSSGIN
jgi:hypothetical protein